MIPGPFDCHRPASVADAAKLLADFGDDARALAGGQEVSLEDPGLHEASAPERRTAQAP